MLYLKRGYIWFDAGSINSFNEISNLVRIMELRQNLGIWLSRGNCIEFGLYWGKKNFGNSDIKNEFLRLQ